MSVKRVVLGDELPAPEWQRLRGLQVRGELPGDREAGRIPLTDNLSSPAWFGVREAQVRGVDLAAHAAPMRMVALQSPPINEVEEVLVNPPRRAVAPKTPSPPQGPLKGRPGVAAIVAGALNTIVAGPNTSARIEGPGIPVNGTVTRGTGRDIRVGGKIKGVPVPVGATGTLDPPTGRAEISASGVKGRGGIALPSRVRIYTTPTGELQFDLPGPITLGPAPLVPKGTYVIR